MLVPEDAILVIQLLTLLLEFYFFIFVLRFEVTQIMELVDFLFESRIDGTQPIILTFKFLQRMNLNFEHFVFIFKFLNHLIILKFVVWFDHLISFFKSF